MRMMAMRHAGTVLLLLACIGTTPVNDGVKIRRKLDANADNSYHVEGALTQSITPPNGIAQSSTATVTADYDLEDGDEPQDGKLPITMKVKHLSVLSSPPSEGDVKDMKVQLKAKVDELNNLTDVSISGLSREDRALASLISRMAQGPGTFSPDEVKPGDSWSVAEQASLLGSKQLEYKLRYDGEQKEGDDTYWALSADEDVPLGV